mmetsp:Transcript_36961/g.81188  ORF Transcript_36961/g.81188 Transcript_36961/m.81188 type:complete len:249 (-) Transcript_36961:2717-3463(-)
MRLGVLDDDLTKLGHVGLVDHAVAVYALRLVHPEARHGHGLAVGGGRHRDEALEHVRHGAQVPLVVELDGGGQEGVGDGLVDGAGGVDDGRQRVLHRLVENVQVAAHDVHVDVAEHLRLREGRRQRGVVALQPVDDEKRAGGRVERGDILHVFELLHRQLLQVEEAAVVDLLAQQRDGGLRAVLVRCRHVDVVDKVDELLSARRPKDRARFLLERLLKHELQVGGGGERVERDVVAHVCVLVELGEQR